MLNPKNIGITSSIATFIGLLFLLIVPLIGLVILLAARIGLLIAFKDLSKTLNNIKIFKYKFKSIVLGVVALIIFILSLYITSYIVGPEGIPESVEDILSGGAMNILFIGSITAWIIVIVSIIYVKKAYDLLASLLNTKYFRWIGLIYLVSAILIVTGLGVLIALVGALVELLSWIHV